MKTKQPETKAHDYWIFTADTHDRLASLVRANMQLGWRPAGTPTIHPKGRPFYQAMVR